jgi:hypothetical protein
MFLKRLNKMKAMRPIKVILDQSNTFGAIPIDYTTKVKRTNHFGRFDTKSQK